MYFLSISENGHLAFTGRHFVHIFFTKYFSTKSIRSHFERSGSLTSLDLFKYIPASYNGSLERISAISCSISKDSTKLVAVDSEKNIYIFTKPDPDGDSTAWDIFTSFKMDMKITRGAFDRAGAYLFLIDKHGNVLISSTSSTDVISKPVQLIRHCAVTQDLIYDKNNLFLFTCDGIENIYFSSYPEPNEVGAFALVVGQAHPLANVILFNRDRYILAVHSDGTINLWDFENKKCIQTWNIFKANHGVGHQKSAEHEVKRLKLVEIFGHIFLAVKIATYKEIPVFEMEWRTKSLRKLGQVKMEYEYSDFLWSGNVLYVYNPATPALVRKFTVSTEGVMCDPHFIIPTAPGHRPDFQSFVDFNKGSLSLNKYFSSDLIQVRQGQKMMKEFLASRKSKASTAGKSILKTQASLGTLQESESVSASSQNDTGSKSTLPTVVYSYAKSISASASKLSMGSSDEPIAGTSKQVAVARSHGAKAQQVMLAGGNIPKIRGIPRKYVKNPIPADGKPEKDSANF